MRLRRLWDDLYAGLVLRFGAVMVLYSACRIGFYIANRRFFADMSGEELGRAMAGGLIFDLSAVGYTNLLYVEASLLPLRARTRPAYQRVLAVLFVAVNAVALAANCLDMGYFPFALRRTTSAFFKEFGNEGAHLGGLGWKIILFGWPVALFWLLLVALLVLLARSPSRRTDALARLRGTAYPAVAALVWLGASLLLAMGLRGNSFSRFNRPITLSNAGAYVDKPQQVSVVLNTPFCILRTLRQPALENPRYFGSEAELASVFDPVHRAVPPPAGQPPNVVLLILESFGAEHIGSLNRDYQGGAYRGFTPFLDGLSEKSLSFTDAFANGTKSVDAMPSITASVPGLFESFILSSYSGNRLNSIAGLLKRRGYETLFFHGAPNGSMGLQALTRVTGYDRYYGMREYGNDADFDGSWGIWDEEFFQFFARKLAEARQPFFATLYSLSSHHPYHVPSKYQGKFPKGPVEVEETMAYTDYALRRMFDTMASLPYYQHTLFVITSDHASMQYRPEYQALVGRFRVPILFHRPDGSLAGKDDRPAQQLDILPTLMHLAGCDQDFVAFGNDLLDAKAPRFAVLYTDGGMVELVQGDHVLHWDGRRTVGLYQYRIDPLLARDISEKEPELRARMERLVKAVIQQFTSRMLEDRLTAASPVAPR